MMLDIQSLKLTLVAVYWPISSGQQFNSEILFRRNDKRRMKASALGAGPRGLPVVQNEGLWRGLLHCKQTLVYCWGAYLRSRKLSGTVGILKAVEQTHRAETYKTLKLRAAHQPQYWPRCDTFVLDIFTVFVEMWPCRAPLQPRICPLLNAESVCLEQLLLH